MKGYTKNRPGKITVEKAQELGMIVDDTTNVAYRGDRFAPSEWVEVYTEFEAELVAVLEVLTINAEAWRTDFGRLNPDSADYDPTYVPKYDESTVTARAILERVRLARVEFANALHADLV